jgi:hypothetical protein
VPADEARRDESSVDNPRDWHDTRQRLQLIVQLLQLVPLVRRSERTL